MQHYRQWWLRRQKKRAALTTVTKQPKDKTYIGGKPTGKSDIGKRLQDPISSIEDREGTFIFIEGDPPIILKKYEMMKYNPNGKKWRINIQKCLKKTKNGKKLPKITQNVA